MANTIILFIDLMKYYFEKTYIKFEVHKLNILIYFCFLITLLRIIKYIYNKPKNKLGFIIYGPYGTGKIIRPILNINIPKIKNKKELDEIMSKINLSENIYVLEDF